MSKILLLLSFVFIINIVVAQQTITFESSDNLIVTADLYEQTKEQPYLLLFHQSGSSRGEYKEIIPKIKKLGFNCLVVDLRFGKEMNFVQNETSIAAKTAGVKISMIDAEKDIIAAIEYASKKSNKPLVIMGSSYSASLCLKVAKDNPKIKAVVAFSPGEFFLPDLNIKNTIKGLQKPIFAASSQREFSFLKELFSDIGTEYKTLYQPTKGKGEHGAKALWANSDGSKEYWLNLMMFLNKHK